MGATCCAAAAATTRTSTRACSSASASSIGAATSRAISAANASKSTPVNERPIYSKRFSVPPPQPLAPLPASCKKTGENKRKEKTNILSTFDVSRPALRELGSMTAAW